MRHALKFAVWLVALAVPAMSAEGVFPESPVRYVSPTRNVDLGAAINAAYASLPPQGGVIRLEHSAAFSVPIVFNTPGKVVTLTGLPGDAVELTFVGSGTAAITFDCCRGHRMGWGLRDLTVSGPGHSTNTVGLMFGGENGAEGFEALDFKIQGFGINLEMGSHTWLARFAHGMIRDGGINALLPAGLEEAGEQITFDHVTFADAPPPHTNSVWIQGGGQEVILRDCSLDQAQLRIGAGEVSAAQVVVTGTHFENPNYNWPGSINYDYVVVDRHPGNYTRITDSYFLNDKPFDGPAQFIEAWGGRIQLTGIGMYTPAGSPLQHFAVLGNNATAEVFGTYDLSGNIKGAFCYRN